MGRPRTGWIAALVATLATLSFPPCALATFPGANGRIAYVAPDSSIHTVLPSGHGDTPIATYGFDPSWSPNGRRLAFTGHNEGSVGEDIFTMRADGSDKRRITDDGDDTYGAGDAWYPSYSPGGGRIVFLVAHYHVPTSVATMRNDGSDRQYPVPYGEDAENPTWSPDNRIGYIEPRPFRDTISDIRPDGSDERELVRLGKGGGYGPIYSPDGSKFLFIRYRRDGSAAAKLADADGTNIRPSPCAGLLTETRETRLTPIAYSPDGNWLLVYRYSGSRTVDLLRLSLGSCSAQKIVGDVAGLGDWQPLPGG